MSVVLRPISASAAEAILAGRAPDDVRVADDHPTEFSLGIAAAVGGGSPLGPYFVHRAEDDVVVGEIGGGFIAPGVAEIGYAIVASCAGRGHATDAVAALAGRAPGVAGLERLVGHTPVDRPASGRVLEKAGFTAVGEVDDEHERAALRVMRWELTRDAAAALAAFDALYDAVLGAHDADAALALFAPDGDIVMWGSEEAERAVGPAAVGELLRGIAASPATLAFRWRERRVHVEGHAAWINAAGAVDVDGRASAYRVTAVLVRRAGAWRWHTHSGSEPG
jgi:RimJ/RimL family protein N-acetyltransferase/ketosteroid isomerase-like protein